jgi:hypothetical protein
MIDDTLIVGVAGQATAGKDTVVKLLRDYIKSNSELQAERVAFADYLRTCYMDEILGDEAFTWYMMEDYDVHFNKVHNFLNNLRRGRDNVLLGVSPKDEPITDDTKHLHRNLLISMGLFFRREVDEDYWLDAAVKKIDYLNTDIVLLSDLRFENEADACDLIVRVVRPGIRVIVDDNGFISTSEMFGLTGRYDFLVDNSKELLHLMPQIAALGNLIIERQGQW